MTIAPISTKVILKSNSWCQIILRIIRFDSCITMLCFVETIVRLKDAFVVSLLHRLLEICEVCYGEGNRFVSIQKTFNI